MLVLRCCKVVPRCDSEVHPRARISDSAAVLQCVEVGGVYFEFVDGGCGREVDAHVVLRELVEVDGPERGEGCEMEEDGAPLVVGAC